MKPLTPKERTKDLYLRRNYHITLEDYNAVLKYQKGRCGICKKLPTEFKTVRAFATDHCHKTGLVRGLLCTECNRLLGKFKDDNDRLRAAAQFVSNPPMTSVFGTPRYTAPHRLGSKVRAKKLATMKLQGNKDVAIKGRNAKRK